MSTSLLIILVFLDVVLLGIVFFLGKKRINPVEIIEELGEERRLLNELRQNLKEEMSIDRDKAKEILSKITAMATDIEMEVKNSGSTLNTEVDGVLKELSNKIDEPARELNKNVQIVQKLLRRIEKEKKILRVTVNRAENLTKFFNNKVKVDEVLEEIEDKKYSDARSLLAQGINPRKVARELGMSESEVNLMVSVHSA